MIENIILHIAQLSQNELFEILIMLYEIVYDLYEMIVMIESMN
jgi:hypothetical protein